MMVAMAVPAYSSPRKSVQKRPSREQRVFGQALEAFERQDYATSRRLILWLITQNPRKGLYWFNLGNAEIKLNRYRAAMRAYERVVKLNSPIAGVAGIYLSKAARAEGNIVTAVKWMQWVGKRSSTFPPNVLQLARDEGAYVQATYMNQGMADYDAGEYAKAIAQFENVRLVDGDPQLAAQADMMRGLCLLKQDRTDQAEAEFGALMARESSNGVQEYARYFARLGQQSMILDPSYWLSTDISVSYNSNLFGDGDSVVPQQHMVIPWYLGGGVRVFRSGLYSLTFGEALSGEEPVGLPSSRYFNNSSFGLIKYQTTGWLVQIASQADYSVIGPDPFAFRPSLSVSAQSVSDNDRFGVTVSGAHQFAESDTFSYVEGNVYAMRAFWIHRGRGWTGGPFVFINRENSAPLSLPTGELPLGFTGIGPGFSGYLQPIQGWEFSGSSSLAWKAYYDLTEPSGLPRNDQTFTLYARAAKRVNRHFAPYISVDVTVNSSTLGLGAPEDKNYTQLIVATGISWDLL
jgi:hypothetical protein